MEQNEVELFFAFALGALFLRSSMARRRGGKGKVRADLLYRTGPKEYRTLNHSSKGLRDRGYIEGKNIILVYRYAEGKEERVCRSRRRARAPESRCHCHHPLQATLAARRK